MQKLALFDVDHTLVRGSAAQKQAFSEAMNVVFGIEGRMENVNYQGKTDQMILIEVLERHELDRESINTNLQRLMDIMVEVYARLVNDDTVVVLSGVTELLENLKAHSIPTGLVTGNLAPIARLKLRRAGLEHYFPLTFPLKNTDSIGIGGFGSDNPDRAVLVRLAIKRARVQIGFEPIGPPITNVILFGDTPRDISAGQEVDVVTVGIATGSFSRQDLLNAGADHAFEDLTNTEQIMTTLFA